MTLHVGPDARADVGTVAATIVWPGPEGAASSQRITCDVGAGGHLELAPEPVIAVVGARHSAVTRVRLAGTATCRVVEEIALGRTGEPTGEIGISLRVERDGRPLVHHDEWFGTEHSTTSVSVGGGRHVLTSVIVGPAATAATSVVRPTAAGAWLPVAEDAGIVVVVAADRPEAQRLLAELEPGTAHRAPPPTDPDTPGNPDTTVPVPITT